MTQGTVLVVGTLSREVELLRARLEKENYSVDLVAKEGALHRWLMRNTAQAILITDQCTKRFADSVVNGAFMSKRNRFVPIIIVTDSEVPKSLKFIKGVGEVFRLHLIPLSQAVARLRLAIQLTQLRRRLISEGVGKR